jgi:hypothetical protein
MIGGAFLGFLAGSGLWLTALTLYFLYTAFHASIEALGHARFLYRQRHPIPTSFWGRIRNAILSWFFVVTIIYGPIFLLIAIFHLN